MHAVGQLGGLRQGRANLSRVHLGFSQILVAFREHEGDGTSHVGRSVARSIVYPIDHPDVLAWCAQLRLRATIASEPTG